jgi:hypothetical protein
MSLTEILPGHLQDAVHYFHNVGNMVRRLQLHRKGPNVGVLKDNFRHDIPNSFAHSLSQSTRSQSSSSGAVAALVDFARPLLTLRGPAYGPRPRQPNDDGYHDECEK